jgi:D-alanyl-D-alanine endopeptidase (penicillin-binding protein 7)
MKRLFVLCAVFLLSQWATAAPITARSWLVADEHGEIIQESNPDAVRSIASITKLMTAMIVLDAQQNPDERINNYTRRELLQLALVHSDNGAAQALCDNYPGGRTSCVEALNAKAHALGLPNTRFVEPTGLSVFNVSTARELVKMITASVAYAEIVAAGHTSQLTVRIKHRLMTFNNTNPLVTANGPIVVSKTGFTNAAGGCLAMITDTVYGRRTVIVLGSKNTRTRIPEAAAIARLR